MSGEVNGSSSKLKDIYNYIETRDYEFECYGWFSDIWTPLFGDNDVLITKKILNFLCSGENNCSQNHEEFRESTLKFETYLKDNDIEFYLVKYVEGILEEYEVLKDEIKNLSADELNDQTWLVLKFEDFEKAVMFINNEHSKFIKNYFMALKRIYVDYTKYIHEHNMKIAKTEITELSRVNENMNVFVQNVRAKTTNGYIYIATSKIYASKNMFKIGVTENLKTRLSGYNTGRVTGDLFYYCFYQRGHNIRNIENTIKDVLCDFKDSKSKEIFVLHYSVLLEVVEMVIKNINQPYEHINLIIKTRLKDIYNLRPKIPEPLDVNMEKILFDELRDKIISLLDEYIKANKSIITRTELLHRLDIDNVHKNDIWLFIKKITAWKNSKKPIIFNNYPIVITY